MTSPDIKPTTDRIGVDLQWPLSAAKLYSWDFDLRAGTVCHSENAAEVLGFEPPSEAEAGFALAHPDDRAAVEACLQVALRDTGRFAHEYRVIVPQSGAIVWIRVHGLVIRDAGQPTRLVGIAQNITQEKAEREALRLSEQRLRLAQEAAGIGTWDYEIESGRVYWSSQYRQLYGLPEDVAPDFQLAIACVIPEDLPLVTAALEKAIQEGAEFSTEHRIRHPQKGLRILRAIGRIIPGEARRVAGIVMDVTERRAAELAESVRSHQLEAAVEAGQLGIWDWDVQRDRVTWTSRVYELHGVNPGEFGGTVADFASLIHPEDQGRIERSIQETLRNDAPYAVEFRVCRPRGGICWLATRATVMRESDGTPVRMVGVTYDITARMQLLEQTERAKAMAEEASRLKDQFLAMLGHELRNPLAPIVSALHIMEMRAPEVNKQERLIISRQVTHLSRLVDDLLDLARISQGKIALDRRNVDLRAVVQLALEMCEPLAANRSAIKARLPSEPVCVYGDFTRLAQVVANLLTNAIKFTPPDKEIIAGLEADEMQARITVEDSGNGIDPALLPRIFEMFAQGEQPLARPSGGLGLGLSLVKGISEMHAGTVSAHSDGPGHGSRFVVSLPRVHADALGAMAKARAPQGSGTVLVVDDNVDGADSLVQLLNLKGFSAHAAHDGASALLMFEAHMPDFAVLDIGLPDVDGYKLARQFREKAKNAALRLIALTGYGLESDREKAAAAGFDLHLVKPVDPESLVDALNSIRSPLVAAPASHL